MEVPDANDRPPNVLVLVAIILVVIFLMSACTKLELGEPMPDPRIDLNVPPPEREEILLAGYWALCEPADGCRWSRLLFRQTLNQIEACKVSMWTVRTILSSLFQGGMAVTGCLPKEDEPPAWWLWVREAFK